jgi:hypothetical protein
MKNDFVRQESLSIGYQFEFSYHDMLLMICVWKIVARPRLAVFLSVLADGLISIFLMNAHFTL